MDAGFTREQAIDLLKKYNKDPFHIRHALTVEGAMAWYAEQLGYGEDRDFWALVGLLHDIDFEVYPEQHCIKAPELLSEISATPELIRAVCSHGWSITVDIEPVHEMERVLFAADELTGLIGAYTLMLPDHSVQGVQLKGLKKKFKDKKFAAGCSRDVIAKGAELLGWELEKLMQDTVSAMQASEGWLSAELERITD